MRYPFITTVLAVALATSALTLAAGVAPDAAAHVHITGFAYDPSPAIVEPGTTITWDNHDSVQHSVTADDGSFDSGLLASGASWSRVFEEEGEYTYFCAVHPNMQGVVRVEVPPPPPPANVPPTVAFTTPEEGATVAGEILVHGTAGDADGTVTRLEVAVDDGGFEEVAVAEDWSFPLDTRALPDGALVLTARVTDDAGATAVATLNLTVDNPEFPDLQVESVTARGNALKQVITAHVTNAGDAPAGAFTLLVEYAYKDAWHVIDTMVLEGVDQGARVIVSVEWDTTLKVGAFPIRVTADASDIIQETEEGNNTGHARAIVGAPVPARDLADP